MVSAATYACQCLTDPFVTASTTGYADEPSKTAYKLTYRVNDVDHRSIIFSALRVLIRSSAAFSRFSHALNDTAFSFIVRLVHFGLVFKGMQFGIRS